MARFLPDGFQQQAGAFVALGLLLLAAVMLVGLLVWRGPSLIVGANLRWLGRGKERLEAEAATREGILRLLGIVGGLIAGVAVAFSYIEKVEARNEQDAARAYFDAVKELRTATTARDRALSLSSIAGIARTSRQLTPVAMDLFQTYLRTAYSSRQNAGVMDGYDTLISPRCRNVRASMPEPDAEVVIDAMSRRRAEYDVSAREWNLSGLDLH